MKYEGNPERDELPSGCRTCGRLFADAVPPDELCDQCRATPPGNGVTCQSRGLNYTARIEYVVDQGFTSHAFEPARQGWRPESRRPDTRTALDAAAERVTTAMGLWVDAVMDHLADGQPNLTEVNRLENQLASAYSGFTGQVARVLLGADQPSR